MKYHHYFYSLRVWGIRILFSRVMFESSFNIFLFLLQTIVIDSFIPQDNTTSIEHQHNIQNFLSE